MRTLQEHDWEQVWEYSKEHALEHSKKHPCMGTRFGTPLEHPLGCAWEYQGINPLDNALEYMSETSLATCFRSYQKHTYKHFWNINGDILINYIPKEQT